MDDLIGSLGLDTKDIEQSLDRTSKRLIEMSLVAKAGDASMLALGAVAIKVATGMYDAYEATKKFNEEVSRINSSGGGASRPLKQVQKDIEDTQNAIKKLTTDPGFFKGAYENVIYGSEEVTKRREAQLDTLQKKLKGFHQEEAEATQFENRLIQMQLDGQKEAIDLVKTEERYRLLIAEAIAKGNGTLADELREQERLTKELIKQNALYNDPIRKSRSSIADEEAKNAIGNLLGDQKNAQDIADREAEKRAKDVEQTRVKKEENKLLAEELDGVNELTRLERIRFEYTEKIEKAKDDGLPNLAKELEIEQGLAVAAEKRAGARERSRVTSERAAEEAGQAADAIRRGEDLSGGLVPKNSGPLQAPLVNDPVADREADRKQEEMDFFRQQERMRGEGALQMQADRDKYLRDLARQNQANARREEITADIGDVKRGTYRDELQIKQEFNERRKKYIEDQNADALKQLDRQEAQALQGVLAAQNRETPAQRRAERNEYNRTQVDADQQKARNRELEGRSARGASSRDIDELMGKGDVEKKMARDKAIAEKNAKQEQGWTKDDADNLQSIAIALKSETT